MRCIAESNCKTSTPTKHSVPHRTVEYWGNIDINDNLVVTLSTTIQGTIIPKCARLQAAGVRAWGEPRMHESHAGPQFNASANILARYIYLSYLYHLVVIAFYFSCLTELQNSVALTVKYKESTGDLPPICGYISGTIQYTHVVRLLFSTNRQSCTIYGTDTADDWVNFKGHFSYWKPLMANSSKNTAQITAEANYNNKSCLNCYFYCSN